MGVGWKKSREAIIRDSLEFIGKHSDEEWIAIEKKYTRHKSLMEKKRRHGGKLSQDDEIKAELYKCDFNTWRTKLRREKFLKDDGEIDKTHNQSTAGESQYKVICDAVDTDDKRTRRDTTLVPDIRITPNYGDEAVADNVDIDPTDDESTNDASEDTSSATPSGANLSGEIPDDGVMDDSASSFGGESASDDTIHKLLDDEKIPPEVRNIIGTLGRDVIDNIQKSIRTDRKLTSSAVPDGQYLHQHINNNLKENDTTQMQPIASCFVYRSMWSKRDHWVNKVAPDKRLAANLSAKDSIEVKTPTNSMLLHNNLIPMNELPVKGGRDIERVLKAERLKVLERKPDLRGVYSQGEDVSSVEGIYKCKDGDGNIVYVDTKRKMPLARNLKRSNQPVPSYYYLVKDYMKLDDVTKLIKTCGANNINIIPGVTMLLLRWVAGKEKAEKHLKGAASDDDKLYGKNENKSQVEVLEKYLIRLLISFVECLVDECCDLDVVDFDRIFWAEWILTNRNKHWDESELKDREAMQGMVSTELASADGKRKLRLLNALRVVLHSHKR